MRLTASLLFILGIAHGIAAAQTPSEPPILLRLIREPARSAASQLSRAHATARGGTPIIGLSSITGTPETWFLEMHDSYASIEAMDQSVDPALVPSSTILIYLPNLSYRPDLAARALSRARYFQASTYRIRPGGGDAFATLMRNRRAALDAANLDRPEMAYHVISGSYSGSYLFLAPLTSLRTLDNGSLRTPAYAAAAVGDLPGGDTHKIAAEIDLVREHQLFRVEPGLSYVSEEFAGDGAAFWRPKFKVSQ